MYAVFFFPPHFYSQMCAFLDALFFFFTVRMCNFECSFVSFLLFSSGCEERCFLLMCRWHMLVILFHYVLVALFCCCCFSCFFFFSSLL